MMLSPRLVPFYPRWHHSGVPKRDHPGDGASCPPGEGGCAMGTTWGVFISILCAKERVWGCQIPYSLYSLLLGLPQDHTNNLIPRVSGGQPSSYRSGDLQPSSDTSPTSHSSWMQAAIPVCGVCGAFRGLPTLCSGCWGRHKGYGGLPSTTASAQGLPSPPLPLLFPHIPPLRSH